MKEKDIQNYLYENQSYLFPDRTVEEKFKEYSIKGKRIDLLFRVDGIKYIVEIKNVPLERKHIGQVVEYYGLMKTFLNEEALQMILVAPRIETWQKTFLEELGLKCFEFKENLSTNGEGRDAIEISNPKNHVNVNTKYWIVPIKLEESLYKLLDIKFEVLKELFKQKESKLNIARFPKDHPSKFVKLAKEGDYLIVNFQMNSKSNIYPPRQIIHVDQDSFQNYYYMETTPDQEKQVLEFRRFAARLSELNVDLKIKESTNRLIPSRLVERFKNDWPVYSAKEESDVKL